MKTGIKVGDIMTRNFVSVRPDTSLTECAKEMIKNRVGSLILKDKKKLYGLITEKDIIWAMTKSEKADLSKIKAEDIAPRKVATIKPDVDLYDALQRMKKLKFRRLPVVIEGNAVGMLTLKDILRIEPTLFSDMSQIFKIREESEKLNRLKLGKTMKEGVCESCGSVDILNRIDNRLLCEKCKEEM